MKTEWIWFILILLWLLCGCSKLLKDADNNTMVITDYQVNDEGRLEFNIKIPGYNGFTTTIKKYESYHIYTALKEYYEGGDTSTGKLKIDELLGK